MIATFLSVAFGTAAGYLGGWRDDVLSLIANVFLVLPALPLLVVLFGFLPRAGNLLIAIVLSGLALAIWRPCDPRPDPLAEQP